MTREENALGRWHLVIQSDSFSVNAHIEIGSDRVCSGMDKRIQKLSISLIEKYKRMPILWNPKDPQYHNRNKREDAWRSISADLKVPASELKAKMRSLMGTFRSERSREKRAGF